MTRELVFRPEAEIELREAYAWYEAQRPGLGDELLLCVEAAVESARREPARYPCVRGDVRRALTRRFPYSVCFIAEEERLVVLAVFHGRRDPRRWHARR